MKKVFRKLAAVVTAATMIMAMGLTAFAAVGDETSHSAVLYKAGTYGTDKQAESMGNGAVDGATVKQIAEDKYAVTVHFKSNFTAYGIKGYLKRITLSGYNLAADITDVNDVSVGSYMVKKTGNAVTGVTYVTAAQPSLPVKLDASFSISVSIMPINASGDLVIL